MCNRLPSHAPCDYRSEYLYLLIGEQPLRPSVQITARLTQRVREQHFGIQACAGMHGGKLRNRGLQGVGNGGSCMRRDGFG